MLTEAVREGASGFAWRDSFAYASGKAEDGRYLGLVMGARQFEPLVDGSGRIVKPGIAEAQPEVTYPPKGPAWDPSPEPGPGPKPPEPQTPPVRTDPTRYFGSVSVDGSRPGPKFGQLATEVIAHLAALDGADVSITVEIKAKRPKGFPADVVRIVNENASQLKFDPGSGFEDE